MSEQQTSDPLHGVTLKQIVDSLVLWHGWDKLGKWINIRCFNNTPSVNSSLNFLCNLTCSQVNEFVVGLGLPAYPLAKNRVLLVEYILLKGINDSAADAALLVEKLRDIPCRINLLPLKQSAPLPYQCPDEKNNKKFQEILRNGGFRTLIRNSRGADIAAACGQLAGRPQAKGSRPRSRKTRIDPPGALRVEPHCCQEWSNS
jgi:hypothetical protein